jgi:sugar lactone lactonase YvrE
MTMDEGVECAWPLAAVLGEGPVWSSTDRTLWFVDIKGSRIHAFGERGATRSFPTPEYAAFVFEATGGTMICGLRSGLFRFSPATGQFERLLRVDALLASNRLNDGYVDASGRLWFGTMDNDERAPTGSLYRFDGASLLRMDAGYVISNGPAMSPDGRTLYHVDTLGRRVFAFDVDAAGALANRRPFTTVEEPGVYPDGPAVDAAGNVWLAMFGGWGVRCYSPAGDLLHTLGLPVAQCTKVAFGGADLRTLYITTARVGLDEAQLARQPLAGALFRTRVPTPGLPACRFGAEAPG